MGVLKVRYRTSKKHILTVFLINQGSDRFCQIKSHDFSRVRPEIPKYLIRYKVNRFNVPQHIRRGPPEGGTVAFALAVSVVGGHRGQFFESAPPVESGTFSKTFQKFTKNRPKYW